MVNWIAEGSSMATDRDKMAHCYTCLQEVEDAEDQQQMDMAVMVEYALASRFLGKFISSPVVRKLTGASQQKSGKTNGRSTKAAKASAATAAGNPAGKTESNLAAMQAEMLTLLPTQQLRILASSGQRSWHNRTALVASTMLCLLSSSRARFWPL
jgi:carbon monoxide dehydrogenase subunit G